jgi:acetyl-CoA carboxylase biotin carboxyl carrier protein
MALDNETIRYALQTARIKRFTQLRVESEGVCFRATLGHSEPTLLEEEILETLPSEAETLPESKITAITSTMVGYYQSTGALELGKTIRAGDVVAKVIVLGLPNDVVSEIEGEIIEVLVEPSQPVEYGQVLARVKVQP